MTDPLTCPSCQAVNPPDSTWCSLCFTAFDSGRDTVDDTASTDSAQVMAAGVGQGVGDPVATHHSPPPSVAETDAGASDAEQLSLIDVAEAGAQTWTCAFCDTAVVIGETECPVCHQTIYDSFGARDGATLDVSTTDALRWSAVPGGGHVRVGQAILGVAIGVLVVISFVAGFLLVTGGRSAFGVVLVFAGVATWVTSAHDAYRFAQGSVDETLLRPRVVSIIGGVVFMIIVAAAVSARSAIPQ